MNADDRKIKAHIRKNMRKVRIDYDDNYVFHLDLKARLHIVCINIMLWFKRRFRRLWRGVKYCKYSLFIIPIWILFILAIFAWGKQRGNYASIIDTVWELKAGFFTSVVITAATSFFTQYAKGKNRFTAQHDLYVNAMSVFSDFYDCVIRIGEYKQKSHLPFGPLYYSQCIRTWLKDELNHPLDLTVESQETQLLKRQIENVKKTLLEIKREVSNGNVEGCSIIDYEKRYYFCSNSIERLEESLLNLAVSVDPDQIIDCLVDMYRVLELLRWPWRRDLKYKLDILRTIYSQDQSIAMNCYFALMLGVVDEEQLADIEKQYSKLEEQIFAS